MSSISTVCAHDSIRAYFCRSSAFHLWNAASFNISFSRTELWPGLFACDAFSLWQLVAISSIHYSFSETSDDDHLDLGFLLSSKHVSLFRTYLMSTSTLSISGVVSVWMLGGGQGLRDLWDASPPVVLRGSAPVRAWGQSHHKLKCDINFCCWKFDRWHD